MGRIGPFPPPRPDPPLNSFCTSHRVLICSNSSCRHFYPLSENVSTMLYQFQIVRFSTTKPRPQILVSFIFQRGCLSLHLWGTTLLCFVLRFRWKSRIYFSVLWFCQRLYLPKLLILLQEMYSEILTKCMTRCKYCPSQPVNLINSKGYSKSNQIFELISNTKSNTSNLYHLHRLPSIINQVSNPLDKEKHLQRPLTQTNKIPVFMTDVTCSSLSERMK